MDEKIAQLIREKRGSKSYREFAKDFDLSHTTLENLEKHLVDDPRVSTLERLAEGLGWSLAEMLYEAERLAIAKRTDLVVTVADDAEKAELEQWRDYRRKEQERLKKKAGA